MLTLNWNIIWTFVDLIVLYVLMKKFLFARVQKVLDQRQEMIQGQMDHAKEQEALANQNLQQAQETVENATKEAREKAQRILEAASKKEKEQLQAQTEELSAKTVSYSSNVSNETEKEQTVKFSDQYRLVYVIGAGSQLQAKIENLDTGQSKTISVGKVVDGYTVKSISLDEGVVFTNGEDTQTLSIGKSK